MDNAKCGDIVLVHCFSHWTFYKGRKLKADKFNFSSFLFLLVAITDIQQRDIRKKGNKLRD